MGIWDWLKKKPTSPEKRPAEIVVDLPELDKDALLEETKSVFESDNEDMKELQLVDAPLNMILEKLKSRNCSMMT